MSGRGENIWEYSLAFDESKKRLAFATGEKTEKSEVKKIYYYDSSLTKAIVLIDEKTNGLDSNLEISDQGKLLFSKDGTRIFLTLEEKMLKIILSG